MVWNMIYLFPSLLSTLIGNHNYGIGYFITSLLFLPNQAERISTMSMTTPADPPLWFIRDLMVCMILSPVIWTIIRRRIICFFVLLPLMALWFLVLDLHVLYPIPGVSIPAFLFFSLGAIAAVWGFDIEKWLDRTA